ncbi:unnamed protein product, partial [Symbiodinium necroappetens]
KAAAAPPSTPVAPPTSKPAQSRPVVKPPSTPAATSTPSVPAAKSTAQPAQPGPQPPPEEKRRRLLANALQRQARTSAPRKRPSSLLTGGAQATKEVNAELEFQQKWFNVNRSAGCKYIVGQLRRVTGRLGQRRSLRTKNLAPGSKSQ